MLIEHLPNLVFDRYEDNSIERKSYLHPITNDLHRDDGKPAVTVFFPSGQIELETWFVDGQLHNPSGPAVIWYSRYGQIQFKEYFWLGVQYSEAQFKNKILAA